MNRLTGARDRPASSPGFITDDDTLTVKALEGCSPYCRPPAPGVANGHRERTDGESLCRTIRAGDAPPVISGIRIHGCPSLRVVNHPARPGGDVSDGGGTVLKHRLQLGEHLGSQRQTVIDFGHQ